MKRAGCPHFKEVWVIEALKGRYVVRSKTGQEFKIKLPRSATPLGSLKTGERLLINEQFLQGLETGQALRVGTAYTVIDNYESIVNEAKSGGGRSSPPALSEFIIRVIATGRTREALLGDLEEKYERDCRSVGVSRARWHYRAEVCRTAFPILRRTLGKIGGAALFSELIHWWLGN